MKEAIARWWRTHISRPVSSWKLGWAIKLGKAKRGRTE